MTTINASPQCSENPPALLCLDMKTIRANHVERHFVQLAVLQYTKSPTGRVLGLAAAVVG